MTKTTTKAIARAISRGIAANFAPENQAAEHERLIDCLGDLAMSRGMDAEMNGNRDARAVRDADLLSGLACCLEELAPEQAGPPEPRDGELVLIGTWHGMEHIVRATPEEQAEDLRRRRRESQSG